VTRTELLALVLILENPDKQIVVWTPNRRRHHHGRGFGPDLVEIDGVRQ